MRTILSIETSGKVCSIALMQLVVEKTTTCIAEYSINVGNKHDKYCAELCNRILTDNDIAPIDLSAVAVSAGPGSFTGLRIGLSVAKGLCFGDDGLKLLAVPTLSAIASEAARNNAQNASRILAYVPSHSNLYYVQIFDNTGVAISEIELLEDGKFPSADISVSRTSGSIIGSYASEMYERNEFADARTVVPLYVQDFKVKGF